MGRRGAARNRYAARTVDGYAILLVAVLAVGAAARLLFLADFPAGINQDEAYAGYEAYSLLHDGVDSHGYHNPVYLVAWGSGMNALYTYLSIPFVGLFGLTTWATRLPQAILGVLTLFVFCRLMGRLSGNRRFVLLATFLLAVNPWHIMMSRWGLESNLVCAFLLFGLYFWVRGLEDSRFFLPGALCYGLSLYCYADIWIVVPVLLVLQFAYSVRVHKFHWNRWTVAACICLVVLALPLIGFLAVNLGLAPEVRTPLFSIPRLQQMRTTDLAASPGTMGANLMQFLKLMWVQDDGLPHSTVPGFGMYYLFSLPFLLLGLVRLLGKAVSSVRTGAYRPAALIPIQLLACVPLVLLVNVNVNRVNCVHLPLILCGAYGLSWIAENFRRHTMASNGIAIAAYAVSFGLFCGTYFSPAYHAGFYKDCRDAQTYAQRAYTGQNKVCIRDINWAVVLYETGTPSPVFAETVQYRAVPAAFLDVRSFSHYAFVRQPDEVGPQDVLIYRNEDDVARRIVQERGFAVEQRDGYFVAHAK